MTGHRSILATGLGIAAANHGHRVLFATATDWVTRLTDAHRTGRLPHELTRLRRYGLIIVDLCRHRDYAEVGVLCRLGAGSLGCAGSA